MSYTTSNQISLTLDETLQIIAAMDTTAKVNDHRLREVEDDLEKSKELLASTEQKKQEMEMLLTRAATLITQEKDNTVKELLALEDESDKLQEQLAVLNAQNDACSAQLRDTEQELAVMRHLCNDAAAEDPTGEEPMAIMVEGCILLWLFVAVIAMLFVPFMELIQLV